MKEKYSAKRQQIYDYLANTDCHPEAEQIYLALKAKNPSLSLATVYRNLARFVSEGKAVEISGANHTAHFDANVDVHYHFSCQECGRIYDVNIPVMELDGKELDEIGQVQRHELVFY